MIVFNSIEIEGFGSIIEPLSYVLNKPGINVIFGPNGCGKTRIISALAWVVYGSTLSGTKVEPWDHVIPDKFKGTKVKVNITIGLENITIIRCKKYKGKIEGSNGASRLFLYINDKYQKKYRDIKPTQAKIIDILGMSFNLFKNSILFGQKLTRLLSEKGDKQKKVFEEAFDIPFINEGRDRAKEKLVALRANHNNLSHKWDSIKASYVHKRELIKIAKDERDSFSVEKEEQLSLLKKEIETQTNYINVVVGCKTQYDTLKNKEERLTKDIYSLEKKIHGLKDIEKKHFSIDLNLEAKRGEADMLKSEITRLTKQLSKKGSTCYTCGQIIDKEEYNKQKASFKDDRTKFQKELKDISIQMDNDKNELIKLASSISKLDKYKSKLKNNRKQLEGIHEGYNKIYYRPGLVESEKIKLTNLNKKFDDTKSKTFDGLDARALLKESKILKKQLKGLRIDIKTSNKSIKLHEWVIKDPLSNKGLKNYIFNHELSAVYNQLKKYGKFLGYTIELIMDLESGNKDFNALIYQDDHIILYSDLSGGQAQLVDVCLAFAIHDAIFNTRHILLVIMDELFESLDDSNIYIIAELIKIKSAKLPTHIITHRKEFLSTKIANKITLSLSSSGITQVL